MFFVRTKRVKYSGMPRLKRTGTYDNEYWHVTSMIDERQAERTFQAWSIMSYYFLFTTAQEVKQLVKHTSFGSLKQ